MIVVVGEALIDLVGEPDEWYRPFPGGSPADVAVGLAELGAPPSCWHGSAASFLQVGRAEGDT